MVRYAVHTLRTDSHELRVTPQNFIEFWNACTRPTNRNGFGLTPTQTDQLLRIAERLFPLLPDSPATYLEWRRLVVNHSVSGVQVYDARLVAAMMIHHVTHILPLNTSDFDRYAPEGIIAVDPATV
jgi:hypothetical protein